MVQRMDNWYTWLPWFASLLVGALVLVPCPYTQDLARPVSSHHRALQLSTGSGHSSSSEEGVCADMMTSDCCQQTLKVPDMLDDCCAQIINLMLTHKYTMRPDTASLLRNPIIVGKVRSY
eukprot:1138207-Pelagomonas_calceolata.AAC.1